MFIWNVSFLFLNYFTNRLLDPIVAAIASSGKTGQVLNFGSGLIKGLVTLIAVVSSATFVSKGANLLGDLTGESINVSSPTAVFKLAGKVAGAGAVAEFAAFKKEDKTNYKTHQIQQKVQMLQLQAKVFLHQTIQQQLLNQLLIK
ncbi:hypothetical protein [Mycoplasma capricolum]|uniref:hypothetical protein n=1 Tax=Mycoplasma capricolum TaxID=2095 RepID=UPI001FB818B1|nr:hypothetical protein [Mycoplasma capricolum]